MQIKIFYKKGINKKHNVINIARKLDSYLREKDTIKKISAVNHKGVHSQKIQEIINIFAVPKLGFNSEKKGLFKKYQNKKLRPDLYKKVGKSGIILEVEKGKTITNNMDLLDLWKCHICAEAKYLFLIVPSRDKAKRLNTYSNVCKRMSSFFIKENYLNIDILVVFGY